MSISSSLQKSIDVLQQENNQLTINSYISSYTSYDNIKNPLNFKSWWNTLISSTDAPYHIRVQIYEVALSHLPASYKLWYNYLNESRTYIKQFSLKDPRYDVINNLHERALLYMCKMPRIWLDYIDFLIYQYKITQTRKTFDNALKALPITQHEKIWKEYIEWIKGIDCPKTVMKVFQRYLKLNQDAKEDFFYFMVELKEFNCACKLIIEILNDDMFYSKKGKSKYDYWLLLCEIIETYPDHMDDIDCENVIRHGLKKYTDEVGRLWVALANYYIKMGVFGKARDIFEEALESISTARDFTLVFDAYLTFEESVVSKNMESEFNENNGDDIIMNNIDNEMIINEAFQQLNINDIKSNNEIPFANNNDNNNTDYKILRILNLLERRSFLLSSTLIRQNPNNVKEWLKRINLYKDYSSIISTYEKAIQTISPQNASGKLSQIYISYASFYESYDDILKMNEIFYRGCNVSYKQPEENITIWCLWVESHLKYHNYSTAYNLIKTVCTSKKYSHYNHSIKLWNLYVDLEQNIGTIEKVKAVYNKMIEMKIANVQTIFNYCSFLEKHNYFEETFRVYEQAIDFFTWPSLYDIWLIYIKKFIKRYKGDKIERVRDMYIQITDNCPKNKIKIFYYMFSNYEEKYGLLNHAINILLNATENVEKEEKGEVFSVLISKTAKYFGITKTRNIFNKALDVLDSEQVVEIGLKYATIEMKLGEIARARAIYVHLSQFCNPNQEEYINAFWNIWEKFEISHGNVETYQEMESIKRNVKSKFSLNVPMFSSNFKG